MLMLKIFRNRLYWKKAKEYSVLLVFDLFLHLDILGKTGKWFRGRDAFRAKDCLKIYWIIDNIVSLKNLIMQIKKSKKSWSLYLDTFNIVNSQQQKYKFKNLQNII